jgi:hypothetical protein
VLRMAAKKKRMSKASAQLSKRKPASKPAIGAMTHTADAVKGALQEVPAYKDLVQPAAREAGIGFGLLVAMLTAMVAGLAAKAAWGTPIVAGFKARMRAKLGDIPPEKLQPSPARVAGPLLMHYPFVAADPELRDLFENLLASSMNKDEHAHPAFVDLLKQMTPDEARLLKALPSIMADKGGRTLAYSSAVAVAPPPGAGYIDAGFVCDLDFVEGLEEPLHLATGIGNIVRLGLLEIDMSSSKTSAGLYDKLESSSVAASLRSGVLSIGRTIEFRRGLIRITDFGVAFMNACLALPPTGPRSALEVAIPTGE